MAAPIKSYSLGHVTGAIFEGDYKGKKTYSFKFQKQRYDDATKKSVYGDFFSTADLANLATLVQKMAISTVKEKTQIQPQTGANNPQKKLYPEDVARELPGDIVPEDNEVPF